MIETKPSLDVHHFRVCATVTEPIGFNEQPGAAIRGALFEALWHRFCVNKQATTCADCELLGACPVGALIAPVREEAARGRDISRPYAIRPPVEHVQVFERGMSFTFGMTIFGARVELFPYVAFGLREMEKSGIGKRMEENGWRRGRFSIHEIQAVNLLTQERKVIQSAASRRIATPDLPTTWEDAERFAAMLLQDRVKLTFLTPTRLMEQKQTVRHSPLVPMVARLMERHDSLAREYNGSVFDSEERTSLIEQASRVEVLEDATGWMDIQSYSRRTDRRSPIGGLIGSIVFTGDLQRLLPLLAWGMVLQAGKNASKGNGIYVVERVK